MVYGVVLAGGVGSRMGGDKPKQYLTVKDKPIIIYTIEKFISVPQLEKILVLCPSKWVHPYPHPYLSGTTRPFRCARKVPEVL